MQPIIKDNFLPDYYLDTINEYIESSTFDWYLLNNISGKENKYNAEGVNFLNNQIGFYHNVYSQEAQSNLFMLTKPFPSWVLDDTKCNWKAPKDKPVSDTIDYQWDEETEDWVDPS